MKKVHLVYW